LSAAMKAGLATSVLCGLLVTGCGNIQYTPGLYPLSDERILDFPVNGDIDYSASSEPGVRKTISYGPAPVDYDVLEVTRAFNAQLEHQVTVHGMAGPSHKAKRLISDVRYLACEPGANFVKTCSATVWIKTGDDQEIVVQAVQHNPNFVDLSRSLDGVLAIAVINALKNQRLLDYMAE